MSAAACPLLFPVTHQHVVALATILFVLGLIGLLTRRNLLTIIVSAEVMLNAAGLVFLSAGSRWGSPDGQVMFLFILTLAAAEVCVALALLLHVHRLYGTLDLDQMTTLRGPQ